MARIHKTSHPGSSSKPSGESRPRKISVGTQQLIANFRSRYWIPYDVQTSVFEPDEHNAISKTLEVMPFYSKSIMEEEDNPKLNLEEDLDRTTEHFEGLTGIEDLDLNHEPEHANLGSAWPDFDVLLNALVASKRLGLGTSSRLIVALLITTPLALAPSCRNKLLPPLPLIPPIELNVPRGINRDWETRLENE
ncbi:unnamed protein product [Ilex paraguariensis]|uniref:Uncharacterized protein n=1 Tax=Ilex paraguariensis TaxID=185542 RepID=A0ABC8UJ32_9AQUA